MGKCKARFPHPTFLKTFIDELGSITVRKMEAWLNTITPLVTYLFCCNTDVTSLSSGTAIKGVVLYVSDYITKSTLKTHTIFDSIKSVFHKNSEMIGGSLPMKENACRFMTKIANLLSAKAEMGAPMICMYLLGNPDVMNHIPLHPFAIKFHPNLIPSLPNLPPMFPPFPPFPDTPSLRRFVTCHPSPVTSSLRHSVIIILHYQFLSLPSFVISDLFRPY